MPNEPDKTNAPKVLMKSIVSLTREESRASGLDFIDMSFVASVTFDDQRLATVTMKDGTVIKLGDESSANIRRSPLP